MMCLICLKDEESLSAPIEDNDRILTCEDCTKNIKAHLAEPQTEQNMAKNLLNGEN